ncbi:protein adenylyltransferase SelO [Reyranella sp.]|uniref:protein adenylyltransferase SelO n=1 Tax=Reyranella sp. TaxID=1929291 RepID=UPI0025DC70D6|nr:YdiU family protein [Reyranella sp.]
MVSPWPLDNSYARLPDRFYARLPPTPVATPRLVKLNLALARQLGLDPEALASPEGVAMLAGNHLPEGADPIATAYAGHQFGNFVPQLGDGRALLLGEVIDTTGVRRDIQLKGAGQTPFSRRGDGRAALGPVLREYLISEAMHALGVPTTRSLAAVTTGEPVYRETVLPGAVLTRVASSHIRVGTFQFFAARGDVEGVKLLADHVIARHYPDATGYRDLYEKVIARQAALVAQWLCIGFIHGVMNTDNVSIAGETIDYGPCAFMDTYHPETVFSSIDQYGRYAYAKQPQIGGWNMARLGEALMSLFAADADEALKLANESLATWNVQFGRALIAGLRRKLGLFTEQDSDGELAQTFFNVLADNGIDFTQAFRRLGEGTARGLFEEPTAFDAWEQRWRQRIAQEPQDGATRREAMRLANPIYIPRNHKVEAALGAATERDDYGPFEELLTVLAKPFEERAEFAAYALPPSEEEQRNFRTFCGT